jgi:hypothetical protein
MAPRLVGSVIAASVKNSRNPPPRLATTIKTRFGRKTFAFSPFCQGSETLGGRSKGISQVCVVWGKAVAVSRYQDCDFALQTTILYDFLP